MRPRRRSVSLVALILVLLVLRCRTAADRFPADVTPPPLPPPATPPAATTSGTTRAMFTVNSGTATYRIPIETPPGTGDMAPDLAVVYSNGGGNGIVGVGFSLSGLGSISRTGRTYLDDGQRGGVNFDANDRFALSDAGVSNGRLVNVNSVAGGYGGDGAVYRTEQESWRRVTASGACGLGPCSFTVSLPNGGTETFAAAAPAVGPRFAKGPLTGSVRSWMLSSTTDPNGNTITVEYTDAPPMVGGGTVPGASGLGAWYPAQITYTSNDAGPLSARRSVRFFYGPRPDLVSSNIGGAHVTIGALLQHVQTFVTPNTTPVMVKDIVLTYQMGFSRRSRLQNVTECDGVGNCMPSLQFQWSEGPGGFTSVSAPSDMTTNAGWVGDFNGDGRTDFVGTQNPLQCLSQASGGFDCTSIIPPATPQFSAVADYNGDGRADLLGVNGGVGGIDFGTAAGLTSSYNTFTLPSSDVIRIADYNGDGMADVFTGSGGSGALFLANGTSFNQGIPVPDVAANALVFLAADFNNDGMSDLLSGNCTEGVLHISKGTSFVRVPTAGYQMCGDYEWVGDFNGDGLPDLLSSSTNGGSLAYGNGDGFDPAVTFGRFALSGALGVWPSDFNGDGRMDLYVSGSQNGVYYSRAPVANGEHPFFFVPAKTPTLGQTSTLIGDFNGDGIADLYDAGGAPQQLHLGGPDGTTAATQNQAPDLLTGIVNGLGGSTQIRYLPITDASVYAPAATNSASDVEVGQLVNKYAYQPLSQVQVGLYPVLAARGALYLVAGTTSQNVPALNQEPYSYSTTYRYANALINTMGRGWLGFSTVTKLDPQLDSRTTETYRQDFPYNTHTLGRYVCSGASSSDACTPGDSGFLSSRVSAWQCTDTLANGDCVVDNEAYSSSATRVFEVLESSRTETNASWGSTTVRTMTYDLYGNPLSVTHTGTTAQSTQYRCMAWLNDETAWRFGFRLEEKVSSAMGCPQAKEWASYVFAPADLSWKRKAYDARMNVVEETAWDDQNALFTGKRYGIDAYGNTTSTSLVTYAHGAKPAVVPNTTSTVTIDSVYQTFPVSTRTALANPADSTSFLTTGTLYDPRFGSLVGQQNANGSVQLTCLDSFGRATAVQGPLEPSGAAADTNCLAGTSPFSVPAAYSSAPVATTTTYSYSTPGSAQVYEEASTRSDWTSSPDWYVKRTMLDGLGRSFAILTESDTAGVWTVVQEQYLDERRLSARSEPFFSNAQPAWITFAYDALGRHVSRTLPWETESGNVGTTTTSWVYCPDNTTIRTYAPSSAVTCSSPVPASYAAQTVTVTDAFFDGHRALTVTETADQNAQTTFKRDAMGRVTSALSPPSRVDGTQVTTGVGYDSLGRVVSGTVSGVMSYQYTYNPIGQLTQQTDALGQKLSFTYDGLDRVLTRNDWNASSQLVRQVAFTYDTSSDSSLYSFVKGRTATATTTNPAAGTTTVQYTFGYDPYGRRTTGTSSIGGSSYTVNATYDPPGHPDTVTYPDASVLNIQYTSGANIGSLTLTPPGGGAQSLVSSDYTAEGKPATTTYSNGASEAWTYTVQNSVATQTLKDAAGALALNVAYEWDAIGNPLAIYDCNYSGNASQPGCAANPGTSATDGTLSFGYTAQRLTSASGPRGTQTFAYDANGNMITGMNGATLTYDGYQLTSGSNGYEAGYDANGNMTSRTTPRAKQSWSQTYDPENQLSTVSLGKAPVSAFQYDNEGDVVVATRYGKGGKVAATTRTVPPFLEMTTAGGKTLSTLFVDDDSGHRFSLSSDGSVRFFHRDPLESTLRITDGSGAVSSVIGYTPWGVSSASPSGSAAASPRFQGRPGEDASGLANFTARWYEPATGRFISPDDRYAGPVGRQDALNRYAFAWSAPATYSDASGNQPVDDVLAIDFLVDVVLDELEKEEEERAAVAAGGSSSSGTPAVTPPPIAANPLLVNTAGAPSLVQVIDDSDEGLYRRASWRKRRLRQLLDDALDGNVDFKCPTCDTRMSGAQIVYFGQNRRDYDVDHRAMKHARRRALMEVLSSHPTWGGEQFTRKRFIDLYHEDLRLQCPQCNQKHAFEPTYFDDLFSAFVYASELSRKFRPYP